MKRCKSWRQLYSADRDSLRDEPSTGGVSPAKAAAITQIKTGVLSALQEDETRFYATAVIEKTDEHLKLATVSWSKEPLESWLARSRKRSAVL